jgi:hypothetical protein
VLGRNGCDSKRCSRSLRLIFKSKLIRRKRMTPEQTLRVKSLVDSDDVLSYVIGHLRAQGCKSMTESPIAGWMGTEQEFCAYRGTDKSKGTTMCAVGALMTDDEYDPSWEGEPIEELLSCRDLPAALRTRLETHVEMLSDLQLFHDSQLSYTDEGTLSQRSEVFIKVLRKKWGSQ